MQPLRRPGDDSIQVPLEYRLKQIDSMAQQVIHIPAPATSRSF